MNMEGASFSL